MKVTRASFTVGLATVLFGCSRAIPYVFPLASLDKASIGRLSLVAGGLGGPGSVDGTTEEAHFDSPQGMVVDASGTVFVADSNNAVIRKITTDGRVTTLAGSRSNGFADGTGSSAQFAHPTSLAIDASGNIFVADSYNCAIRKVTPVGVVTTLAGGPMICGFADGPSSTARFANPAGVAVDGAGNVFVADTYNYRVRKIDSLGNVTTIAGSGPNGYADGPALSASFRSPQNIVVSPTDDIYVLDWQSETVRRLSGGVVTTIAGQDLVVGSQDGPGSTATFQYPFGLAMDSAGNLYLGDSGNRTVRKIDTSFTVSTVAGQQGFTGDLDGPVTTATFNNPFCVATDAPGNIYVCESNSATIRKITMTSVPAMVSTLAGRPISYGNTDGVGSAARLSYNPLVVPNLAGGVWVADQGNYDFRRVDPDGTVTTVGGAVGVSNYVDATTMAAARFMYIEGAVSTPDGNVFVADGLAVRKISTSGEVSTFAGLNGGYGSADGTGTAAQFQQIRALGADPSGTLYVADDGAYTVRKITAAGVVTTVAGVPGSSTNVDGPAGTATLGYVMAITADQIGNIYTTDSNMVVRKIAVDGSITTLAGTRNNPGSLDGIGAAASFSSPQAIVFDATSGNLYVGDGALVRKITASGEVTTVVGQANSTGVLLTVLPASLSRVTSLAINDGLLYIGTENSIVSCPLP